MYLVKSPRIIHKLSAQRLTWRMDKRKPELFLTFDDGPVPGLTRNILDILEEKQVPASFFCVGDNIRKYPGEFKSIINAGHTVGNHTFNHLNGWRTPNSIYLSNVRKFDQYYNSPFFRPPYGKIKPTQIRLLDQSYRIILWSILSGDFDFNTTPYKCFVNVTSFLHNGAIIVFHDNLKAKNSVLYALPRVIDYARKQGYEFRAL